MYNNLKKLLGKTLSWLGTSLCSILVFAYAASAAPSIFPTGTTIYDPAEAHNGYVLISLDCRNVYSMVDNRNALKDIPKPDGGVSAAIDSDEVYLMDMNGNIVNRWSELANNKKIHLLPNGNLLSVNLQQKKVIEYDWSGKQVWEFKNELTPHHDLRRLENGNTLILYYEDIPPALTAKITDQKTQWWGLQKRKNEKMQGDIILEVTPAGKVVWEWKTSEHMQDYINRYNPMRPASDWTHGNTISIIPPNKWYDAGDKRFKPGNILFNPRNIDEFMIIDKDSKKIVWTYSMKKPLGGLSQCHEPNMIPKGMPGEGNIIVFDNGLFARHPARAGQSAVFEINPSTQEVVWRYFSSISGSVRFFSKFKGSAYKLPNGNVLISEDMAGRVFQVKPDVTHPDGGKIIWEYQSDTIISRTTMYPYDFTPQLKSKPRPKELKVSPINPYQLKVLPDIQRKGNEAFKILNDPAPNPVDDYDEEIPTMKVY